MFSLTAVVFLRLFCYNDGSDTNRCFYQVQGIFMFTEGFPKELNNACLHTVSKISNKTVNNVSCGISDEYNSDKTCLYKNGKLLGMLL